ncbi:DEAD/DEAH box helicase [Candidatus Neomicrothrix sp.]|uniref:DEAD/DEAH box helicase n=1 Tax=Candidatus Neomicrothrix sp. TaxID=2719034 RepID=UPI001D82ECE6|nr:DEAD/DEAH box helicase [Candidatus Microthrix sp.]MBK6438081.1 DEAD/DEAH box helicase [Candidatus Microthrix sp.]HMS48593.1 DEAD/DEAH box helicase [Candidatus Microthrix sp.]
MATRIRLRPWQHQALEKFNASERDDFLAVATPGAGKTTFALTAASQYLAGTRGRRLIIVAPTQHLKTQWSDAAARFGLHLDPAWSAREGTLPGDVHGIVTTYQQVATSSVELSRLAAGAFVIFDEVHHAGDDRAWGTAIMAAFANAGRRLSLSGTPFRSDVTPIPFVTYHLDEAQPDFEYGYGDALADRGVVRPLFFPRIGGFMEWVAPDGAQVAATFEDDLTRDLANQRLRTALSLEGEWMSTVLAQANERLQTLRQVHPEAGGLVIAMDQAHATGIAELLRKLGTRAVVAVSDDPGASDRIARFSESSEPWIVAVRMVSEGVDIPRLRIGVYATNTSTELFFRQAMGRLVRWTRGVPRQRAWCFLPDDPRLRSHADSLATQRRHSLAKRRRDDDDERGDEPAFDSPDGADEADQMSLFAVIGAVAQHEPAESEGVFADDGDDDDDGLDDDRGVDLELVAPPTPDGRVRAQPVPGEAQGADAKPQLTARQRRSELRDRNASLARDLARRANMTHAQVNRELNRLSGVTRISEATEAQLQRRLDEANRWSRRVR